MTTSSFSALLATALRENHLSVSAHQQQLLSDYLNLMTQWNRVFNLTTITAPRDMVYLHVMDSLIIKPYLKGTHCLDVGSGAGLPGIPLAIVDPTKHWMLLDKNSKKTRFLTQAVATLALKNVNVVHARVNDFHPARTFDTILSRAVGSIAELITMTEHLLAANGIMLAMKGKYPQTELSEIPSRFLSQNVIQLSIKGMNVERHVVVLAKEVTNN